MANGNSKRLRDEEMLKKWEETQERVKVKRAEMTEAIDYMKENHSERFPHTIKRLEFDLKYYNDKIAKNEREINGIKERLSPDYKEPESLQLKGSPL